MIVLKRHAEALHELSSEEAAELGVLQWATSTVLASEVGCAKEYSVLFAEAPRFNHLHFHIVPRPADLAEELRGGKVFAFLKAPEAEHIPPSDVADFCIEVGRKMRRLLD